MFAGHNVIGLVNDDGDFRQPVPHSTTGSLYSRNTPQTFARTKGVLGEGMCGGPVILERPVEGIVRPEGSSKESQGSGIRENSRPGMQKLICGLVEGIVPMDYIDINLRGLAGFVPSNEIARLARSLLFFIVK